MKQNQLKAGAVISYLNLLIGNLIPFIYTPNARTSYPAIWKTKALVTVAENL